MTEQQYLDRTDAREFEATVERVREDRIVLDTTLFYPEGGGQPHDEGFLEWDDERTRVTDVQKTDTIYHTLEGPVPDAGQTVRGVLDWERRHAHMRYHTAQHLLSAVLLETYDAPTTGNQLYADRARIDCEHDRFDETDLRAIEDEVNAYVEDRRSVTWTTLDREAAMEDLDPERTRLDLLPESITEVRIVEIAGVDRTACAGTHVSNTGEIGPVRVTGRETKGSDEERIRFELVD